MDETFDARATAQLTGLIGQWDQGAICLAALAVATGGPAAETLTETARDVMTAAGLGDVLAHPERLPFTPAQLHGMAVSPLLQAAVPAGGGDDSWAAQSDAALLAQGQASGSTAMLFVTFVLPHFAGLADRLARPGARMLDVGTGIGALAAGFARAFPHLHVTGIDVMSHVLDMARAHVGSTPAASRVELRRQDVADLTGTDCYDLAWLPAPFVPEPALSTGVGRIATALRPGGVLMIGHGAPGGTDLANAITRFRTAIYGGTALAAPAARDLLSKEGLTSVQTVDTPPGAPVITAGQKQPRTG